MIAIIKKEVKNYFLSPIGYIFIGLFLAMCSLFFFLDVYELGSVNLGNMFYSGATIITFIIPILTMRMFAEEKKNGTEQLLMTSPTSITSIVLGKFISAIIIVIIAEACTFLYFGILSFFGEPHLQTMLVTLLGFLLLSIAYISFGMLASSITENQIIAAVLTIGFFIMTWFLPNINSALSTLSLINMFDKFPSGLIALEEIVTYISFTIMCLLFTLIIMQRRKGVK